MHEKVYEAISKKAIGCMRVSAAIVTGIVTFTYGIIRIILWQSDVHVPFMVDVIAAIILIFMIIADIAIIPVIRWRRYRYAIDEEAVDIEEGLWFIERNMVPIERIHQIEMLTGPVDRLFGLAKVIVTTAGGTVTIRFLEKEKAEAVVSSMQKRIKKIIAEQVI